MGDIVLTLFPPPTNFLENFVKDFYLHELSLDGVDVRLAINIPRIFQSG